LRTSARPTMNLLLLLHHHLILIILLLLLVLILVIHLLPIILLLLLRLRMSACGAHQTLRLSRDSLSVLSLRRKLRQGVAYGFIVPRVLVVH
jgi:hypothetical protein